MDNPEKLATQGTQDEDKQNKNTTQHVLDTTTRKQTQITYIRHESSYKQLECKDDQRTSFNFFYLFCCGMHVVQSLIFAGIIFIFSFHSFCQMISGVMVSVLISFVSKFARHCVFYASQLSKQHLNVTAKTGQL